MFGRPRCREWTPLSTQQLRLRSLIQIVGYNIRPPEGCTSQCSFYLTLHHTTMSAPFYTTERISSLHPKWKEIDSEITQGISSTNVVIRIWCHIICARNEMSTKPQDTIIQTWGVYFSGLRYIGANLASNFTSDCFKSNTLVFQMHGGYFCSYNSLKLDIIPPEYDTEHGSQSSYSSGRTRTSKIADLKQTTIDSRSLSPSYRSKSDKEYSKSHSPVETALKQNFPTVKLMTSMTINQPQRINHSEQCGVHHKTDPKDIYEHSPDHLDVVLDDDDYDKASKSASKGELSNSRIDLSETAENYDLRNASDRVSKYRYLAHNFLKSEIRHSYNATKLQQLHLLQYSIKKRQDAMQEVKERIYKKNALTSDMMSEFKVSDYKLRSKTKIQRNLFSPDNDEQNKSQTDMIKNDKTQEDKPQGPRLTLKLNDLLSFKSKPSPSQRAEHLRLTKQLEILRFKRIILADERDRKLTCIRRLKETHVKLVEENQDVGLELMQEYHTLTRRREVLKETRQSCGAIRELATRSFAELISRRSDLLKQLTQIFHITQENKSVWRIIDVPLPICGDDNPRGRSLNPVADSVAAGFAAQVTCLTAVILNQPLRYRISLLGSACKIMDVSTNLPDPNIPLFARGGDITLFRYAMFLLNKNIAQLLWGSGHPVPDMRPTLFNLQRLMTMPTNMIDNSKLLNTYRWLSESHQCPRTQSLRSLVASDRGKQHRKFNRFKDSVDGQSPTSAMNLKRHRPSRSVGSYQDDQDLSMMDQSTASMMLSDPNIYEYNSKLTDVTSMDIPLFKRSSDSDISTISTEQKFQKSEQNKVIFTLGDDTTINIEVAKCDIFNEPEKLVRLSTNNGDEAACSSGVEVTQICTEITDFCTKKYEIHEGFDIAQHIKSNENITQYLDRQTRCEVEIEVDICKSCESNKDGICNIACADVVADVVVIPIAEAIIDTRQPLHTGVDINEDISKQIDEIKRHLDSEQCDKFEEVNTETDVNLDGKLVIVDDGSLDPESNDGKLNCRVDLHQSIE